MENSTFEVGIIWGITRDNARKRSSCLMGAVSWTNRKAALVLSYMFFFASVLIDKGAKLKTPSRRSIWHSCLLVCVFLCFALIS